MRLSAAASLGPVLETLRPALERELGIELELNLAGSGTLARQLLDGAPADAVVLAHPAWMDALAEAGVVDVRGRVDLVGNALVVVGRGEPIAGPAELADPRFTRIALGDPASVPAGRYAEQALRSAGVWSAVKPRLITAGHVRAALSYAAAGEVDAAVVYATDADAGVAVLCEIDPALHGPIVYPAAAVGGSEAGRRVVTWLSGEEARRAFAAAGFVLP